MFSKTYSRKQMGVIYRAVKEGKLELEKWQISYLYDCADGMEVFNTNDKRIADELYYGMRNAIDFIFEGNYKSAMVSIESMLEA